MRFMLFYAGVFALIALTASVAIGLAATDRAIMSPGGRIAAQAAHRAASFAAVGFLAIHITVEVLAGRTAKPYVDWSYGACVAAAALGLVFRSGEGGALVNAVNGHAPLPPGRKRRASDGGVDGLPTLLSNAETFAQLAVLGLLGAEGYASAGTAGEPGTVLLTVGGSAARPAVVEVPTGTSLGTVLDICEARAQDGVLVGGYHGAWLPAEVAYDVPVSRAGLEAAGGALGAGVVLPLGPGTCPLGEVARVARYLAAESSGQCGPCKLGLPGIARALSAIVDGSGGMDALETARRAAGSVRGRGACHHPDGTSRFVLSALEVFTADLAAHVFRGGCGLPVRGVLPLPGEAAQARLLVDWTRCAGHGLCARLVPELVQLDRQGYPVFLDMPVPFWLERGARQAVAMCPALALRVEPGTPLPASGRPAIAPARTLVTYEGGPAARGR
jgi:ferredoxin